MSVIWVSVTPLCTPEQCYTCFQRQLRQIFTIHSLFSPLAFVKRQSICRYWLQFTDKFCSLQSQIDFVHIHNRKWIGQVIIVGNSWTCRKNNCQLLTLIQSREIIHFFGFFLGFSWLFKSAGTRFKVAPFVCFIFKHRNASGRTFYDFKALARLFHEIQGQDIRAVHRLWGFFLFSFTENEPSCPHCPKTAVWTRI